MIYDLLEDLAINNGGLIIGGIALLVSVVSAFYSHRMGGFSNRSGLIKDQFNAFDELTRIRLENWHLNHLFELEPNYEMVSRQVGRAVGELGESDRQRMLLQERAVALAIFQAFEQNLYQIGQAKEHRDSHAEAFLSEVCDYFTGRLLRNPRLLFYWAEDGGKSTTQKTGE